MILILSLFLHSEPSLVLLLSRAQFGLVVAGAHLRSFALFRKTNSRLSANHAKNFADLVRSVESGRKET